jgi:hypothetical protein
MTYAGWVAVLALALGTGRDEDLAAATKKASGMEAYGFKVDTKIDGKGGKGLTPLAVEGRYQKDQPTGLKALGSEAFRQSGVIVVKEGEAWKRLERKKGEKPAKGQVSLLALGSVRLPHEELAEFEKNFEKSEKAPEGEGFVFSGPLTGEGAKALASAGDKAAGKARAALTYTGSAKVWVNQEGAVTKYEISLKGKGTVKDKEVEVSMTRTVELSEIGTAKVEVPEGAKKALAGQS